MKTILAATDFSPAAMNAVNYAADMAVAMNAGLYLLHVYQVPISYSEVPLTVDVNDILRAAEKDMMEVKALLLLRHKNNLNITTEVRMGFFFEELKLVCEKIKPYTVVMGSQGTTATEHFLFGGHTVYAMKHLAWPLITVPAGLSFSSIRKIGLACDFEDVVETTPLEEIKILVKDFKAELLVLNTGRKDEYDPDIVFESAMLQEMLDPIKPSYHFISSKNIDEGIMDFAEKNQIDLLLVLPKRHDLLDKLVHRSHTRQLVLHSHVPVLALHQS